MGLLGWASFGILVRMGQLWILKRPLSYNIPVYGAFIAGFGTAGYFADDWVAKSDKVIAEKRESIRQHRLEAAKKVEKEEYVRGVLRDLREQKEGMDPEEFRKKVSQTLDDLRTELRKED